MHRQTRPSPHSRHRPVRATAIAVRLPALALPMVFAGAASTLASTPPAPVALSGTAAPAGGNDNEFQFPVLNNSRQVAFYGILTGGSSFGGVFAGAPAALQAAAVLGTAAPAGGNYDAFLSNTLLNDSGRVAFYASLSGGSSSQG